MTNKPLTLNPDYPLTDAEKAIVGDMFLGAATDISAAGAVVVLRGEIFGEKEPVVITVQNITGLPSLVCAAIECLKTTIGAVPTDPVAAVKSMCPEAET